MNKLQIVVVNVEDDAQIIQDALRAGLRLIKADDVTELAPAVAGNVAAGAAIPLPSAKAPAAISDNGGRKSKGRGHYSGPPVKCRYCDKMCATPQGRGKHEHSEHGDDLGTVTEQSSAQQFWCPAKNCLKSFKRRSWRDKHVEKEHGK